MPSCKIIGLLHLEKNILNVFAIYSHGSHLCHVTIMVFHMKPGFDWPRGFQRRCLKSEKHNDDGRRSMSILYAHFVSLELKRGTNLR